MSMRRLLVPTIVAVGLIAGAASPAARASYVQVDLSAYVDTSFSNLLDATSVPYPTGASSLGSNLTGVPFSIANVSPPAGGGYGLNFWGGWPGSSDSPPDYGDTLAITGLDIAGATTAYTLINTTFGAVPDFPVVVTFVSTGGSLTFTLFEGTQVRDYNNGIYVNTLGTGATNWFNNGGNADITSDLQRLDQQTFDLTSLTGHITEVDITSSPICNGIDQNGNCINGGSLGGETTIFAGLTFLTPARTVPEPATLALLAAGLAGMKLSRRRKRA